VEEVTDYEEEEEAIDGVVEATEGEEEQLTT